MADALIKNAAGQHSLLDCPRNRAAPADGVNCFKVMPVTATDRQPALQVYSKRSSQQRLLQVVNGDRFPAEQHLHITFADELRQMLPSTGVDYYRPRHDYYLAALLTNSPQFP